MRPPQFDPVRVSHGDDAPLLTCQEVPSKVVEINQDDTPQFDPVESRRPSDGAPRIAGEIECGWELPPDKVATRRPPPV